MDLSALVQPAEPINAYGNVRVEHLPDSAAAYMAAHKVWMASPDETEKMTIIQDTPSMLGSGLNGSYVIHKPSKEFVPGDVAIVPNWKGDGNTSIHTVTAVDPVKGIYTKGSFNSRGDGWTPWDEITGKVLSAYKGKKK